MEEIRWDDKVITYEMKPNPRSKRIKITIVKDKVRVSFPPGTNYKRVREFVLSKKEWIVINLEKHKAMQAQLPVKSYLSGEEYFLCGKKYLLKIIACDGFTPSVKLEKDELKVYLPDNTPPDSQSNIIKDLLEKWYKNQARKIFLEKLAYYSKVMGLEYNQVRIKNQKTRWGSCSSKGNINLNWRVVMAPEEVINYLVIHELAHLKYMNHSTDFWNLVKKYCPDYVQWKKWLREKGKTLTV